jgi:hypothetical protein
VQAGAQPVSQPPAPGAEPLPVMVQATPRSSRSLSEGRLFTAILCAATRCSNANGCRQADGPVTEMSTFVTWPPEACGDARKRRVARKGGPVSDGTARAGKGGRGRSPAAHQRRVAKIGSRSCQTEESGSGLRRFRRRSCFLAAHPLQVHAGRNQLQSLLVTVTDREWLHAWGLSATRGAAAHAVRARCGVLLYLQVRKLSGEASVFAVLRQQPLNLFLTLLPVHCAFRAGW